MEPKFEWDENKARKNLIEHKVSFNEAKTVFADPLSIMLEDEGHSQDEQRYLIIGRSIRHKLLIVSYTERDDIIRIISARKPTTHERKNYEEYR